MPLCGPENSMTASRAGGRRLDAHALGRTGGTVSVSEREVDGLELVRMPARPDSSLDAFIDLRTEPDGLALAPTRDATASPASERPPADARGFLRHYQQLAAGGDAVCAAVAALIALVLRFGTWQHVPYDALTLAVPVQWVVLLAAKRGYE